jgi:replicative DNA helicase
VMATAQLPPADLPSNVEAEAALLGALLQNNKLVDRVADRLLPEHFSEAVHGRIFAAITTEVALNRVANPVTLRPYFTDDESMRELGGPGYLAQLTGSGAAVIGADDFTDQVIELARRRRLRKDLEKLIAETGNYEKSYDVMVAEAEAAINEASFLAADGVVEVSASKAMVMAIEPEIMDPGVRSGITALDDKLGPIKPTELVIVAGRPGMGKTVLGTSYGLGVAKQQDEDGERRTGVVFFSLEMGAEQLGERIAADLCFNGHVGIAYADIEAKRLTSEQARTVARAASEFENLPFQIVDIHSLTSAQLDSSVRRWKRRYAAKDIELKLIIVDYLQLLKANEREKDLYTRITEVSKALKSTAKRHRVGVMAIAQLSRDVEKRENKRPTLADLRDSGQIEQDADGVVFVYRDEYYLTEPRGGDDPKAQEERAKYERALDIVRGQIEFIIAKRRGRPAPVTARGRWHGPFQAIRG